MTIEHETNLLLTRASYLLDRASVWREEAIVEAREMASAAMEWIDVAAAHVAHHAKSRNEAGVALWRRYEGMARQMAGHHLGRLETMLVMKEQGERKSA